MSAAYIRVSTDEQNLSLQEDLIAGQNPGRLYSDRESGNSLSRSGYVGLCKAVREGTISEVVVYRLDRLGRDPLELIRFFDLLDDHQVIFVSLTEPWLTDWNKGPMQFLTWWLQLGMARFELLLLKDRQKRGIAAQQDLIRKGVRTRGMGRPKKK